MWEKAFSRRKTTRIPCNRCHISTMPFFKVEMLSTCKSILVKADGLEEIMVKSMEKFNIPFSSEYKLMLDDLKTDVDPHVIEFAKERGQDLLKLILIRKRSESTLNYLEDMQYEQSATLPFVGECSTSAALAEPICSFQNNDVRKKINVQEGIWKKVSANVRETCEKGNKLSPSERRTLVKTFSNYVFEELKDFQRGTADFIARQICKKYPDTFSNKIEGHVWDDGVGSLRQATINAVYYKKSLATPRKKKNPIPLVDSDEEEIREKNLETSLISELDQYWCVSYASVLPASETEEQQEMKRQILEDLFMNLERDEAEVSQLMRDTYPTVRALINNPARNLMLLNIQWPFLKNARILLEHSELLLGKDVEEIWTHSLTEKVKFMRQYLKKCEKLCKKKEKELADCLDECKNAVTIRKDEIPKILLVFKLLLLYFSEDSQFLYEIAERDAADQDIRE